MIVFDLKCAGGHQFEAWFGSSADYEGQKSRGLVSCPACGTAEVAKAVMAPAVGHKGNQLADDRRAAERRLKALREEVESRCDYVGQSFVAEARARFGEGARSRPAAAEGEGRDGGTKPDAQPPRGIYGEATLADAAELWEEGIPVAPLPFRPRRLTDA